MARILTHSFRSQRRLFRKAVSYVEPLSAARTLLADFINSLLAVI